MSRTSLARIHRSTPHNLQLLARRLRAGEIVAVPTETVYGLAGNAFDAAACAKIFRAKERPQTDPLIVHLHSIRQLPLVCRPNAIALKLARRFWPGPLTLILPKTAAVPDIVSAGKRSVAVRIPRHPVFRRLLKLTGVPLAAPSANPFGYISPTTALHVRDGLGRKIGHILDGGPAGVGLESTILDLRNPRRPRVLRPGAITAEELAAALGTPVAQPRARAGGARADRAQLAPGLLTRHYSPRTPVTLHKKLRGTDDRRHAYLFFCRPEQSEAKSNVFWLDEKGDLRRAAQRLFGTLRKIDAGKFEAIQAELAPGGGLAFAINDRLRRAAAR